MNLLFANAWLWPFVAAIAVPVLVHLFARARPPVYPFSSLRFLRHVTREQHRVRKPREWLVLALRTLLVAALLAAFLQPLWFGGRPSPAGAGRNLVLIVDATASMACRDGAQSRFAAACGEAADVLSGLTTRDRADLVWLRSPPQAVFPRLGVNHGFLRDSLRQGRVTSEAGDPAAALRLAADLLAGAEGRREICIVSDFQRTTWRTLGAGVPPGIDVVTVPVARQPAANMAITRLSIRPAEPLAGEDVQVLVDVANYSDTPRQTGIHAEIGEQRASQNVHVPAWGRLTAVFPARGVPAGELLAVAHLGEDSFAGDNSAWRVVSVRPGLKAGWVAADAAASPYWRQALKALPWVRTVDLAVAAGWEADAGRCDALLLCGWNGDRPAPVRDALAAGKPVVWYPARGTPAAALGALVPGTGAGAFDWVEPRQPLGLRIAARDDAVFAVFAGGDRGNPAAGRLKGRLSMPPLPAEARVLLAYDDDTPALVRLKAGEGSLAVWNLALDPASGGWGNRPEFLPLLAETLLSCRGPGAAAAGGALVAGQELAWEAEREWLPRDIRVDAPDGNVRPVTRREGIGGTPVYVAGRATQPGLYTWRLGDDVLARTAVNFPPDESDLRTLPPPAIEAAGWAAVDGGRAARERRDGVPLWPWCLGLALVCGLGEAVAAWRVGRL